jgi:hypothetical protein
MTTIDCSTELKGSVADPGCLSWIPDPYFYLSRIWDIGSRIQQQQERRRWKKFFVRTFLCGLKKFDKIENYFIFEEVPVKKTILSQFTR